MTGQSKAFEFSITMYAESEHQAQVDLAEHLDGIVTDYQTEINPLSSISSEFTVKEVTE